MELLQVVAEPRRTEILRLIWDDELSVSAITERVDVSTAAVSQHLAKLRVVGAVTVRRDGKRRMYRAERGALAELAPLLERMWADDIDRLAALAETHAEDRPGEQ